MEATEAPENVVVVGPYAEGFVPNAAWKKFMQRSRHQRRKMAPARWKSIAYAAERGEDPEYDPDSVFSPEEEEEIWGLVQSHIHDQFYSFTGIACRFLPPRRVAVSPLWSEPSGHRQAFLSLAWPSALFHPSLRTTLQRRLRVL